FPEIQFEQTPHFCFIFDDQNSWHGLTSNFLMRILRNLARQRKKYYEAGSFRTAAAAFYSNGPVVAVNNPRHDRQPEPDSGLLGGYKRIKHLFPQFGSNSWACVFNS